MQETNQVCLVSHSSGWHLSLRLNCTDAPTEYPESPDRGPVSEFIAEEAESGEDDEEDDCEDEGDASSDQEECPTLGPSVLAMCTPEKSPALPSAPSIKVQRKIAQSIKKSLLDVVPIPFVNDDFVDLLDDSAMADYQNILGRAFPAVTGFQPPALGALRESGFATTSGVCVQVLNDFHSHWLATARTSTGLYIADSLLSEPNKAVIDQLVELYADAKTPHLDVEYIPCQRQMGSTQCGDYAAFNAFLFAKCITFTRRALLDVFASTHWDQSEMRDHVLKTISAGTYTPPPSLDSHPACTIQRPILFRINTLTRKCYAQRDMKS
jgi:hypothetical protein